MSVNFEEKRLTGWGRVHPERCHVRKPETGAVLRQASSVGESRRRIARGCGRSYGDAAQNGAGDVIVMTALNRILSFDEVGGRLTCEAGTTLAEIVDIFAPRGWFPSVVPGTKFVTVGGAIASDIHGKNHHRDGSFSKFVDEVVLILGTGERVTASRVERKDLFWATVGGMGLTGVIESASIRLRRIGSDRIRTELARATTLEETIDRLRLIDSRMPYTVAWIDTLGFGSRRGRSVIISGDHESVDEVRAEGKSVGGVRRRRIRMDAPGWLLNRFSIRIFNDLYWLKNRPSSGELWSIDQFFFPLDSVDGWNRLYGPRGFIQFQCVIPDPEAVKGLCRILDTMNRADQASFLAVLKRFGPSGAGLLSFPREGWTLAVDLPMSRALASLARSLERIVLEHGGRTYFAKDALGSPEAVGEMYPRLSEFREVQARFDPFQRMESSLSRRLRLLER